MAYRGAALPEVPADPTMPARAGVRPGRGRRAGGAVTLESGARAEIEQGDELPEIVVMASGCLGLVSVPREPRRVTLERLGERYPGLVPALLEHPGIGFVLVRSEDRGAVVLGACGTHHLDE